MNNAYRILLYYKYVEIKNPREFLISHKKLCIRLYLKGRIIIAEEGINGTVEGTISNIENYINEMKKDKRFSDIHFKEGRGNGRAFPKLSIKLRNEIVSSHLGKGDPKGKMGKYITPEELHNWIHSSKGFYIVDMRNDYEHSVGYFKNSVLAPFENFRDLPKILEVIDNLKEAVIVTVCTGGVRCEKASGFLINNGFKEVYQLYGGIVNYMEKYPNEDFLGKLYVFDGRVTIGFNVNDPKHQVVGRCTFCRLPADSYYDCKNTHCGGKRHFVSCVNCIAKYKGYCPSNCQTAKNETQNKTSAEFNLY